jgi:hypothetical protein
MQSRVTAHYPPARRKQPCGEIQQGRALGVVEVVQQAEKQDRIELAQLAKMFSGKGLAAEIALFAVLLASVSNVRLRCIEADVIYLGQPAEVVRRAAAHIKDPLARLELRFGETMIADAVGADTLLHGNIEADVSQHLSQRSEHS